MRSQPISVWRRIIALVKRSRLERELDEELSFHRAMSARRFGNEVRVREQARDAWMFAWIEALGQDLRYAARALRRTPSFTLGVIIMLALGIGINCAIFSLAYGVLWKPLPYPDSSRIVDVKQARGAYRDMQNSNADVAAARLTNSGLQAWVVYRYTGSTLTGVGAPLAVSGLETESQLFPLLGVKPLLGRLLSPADDNPGAAPVVLLGTSLWRDRFAANPAVVGRVIHLDGKPFTVVGVLPDFDVSGRPPAIAGPYWIPWREAVEGWGDRDTYSIARLGPGITIEAAQQRLDQEMARLAKAHDPDQGWRFHIMPLRQHMVMNVASTLGIMLAVVGGVLLIAAVNLAALLLARAQTRRRELATRAALGASRNRIIRQLLTETALLLTASAAAGLALAAGGIAWLRSAAPTEIPRINNVTANWPVIGFALALTAVVGAIFGLAPAIRASAPALESQMRQGAASLASRAGRGRPALVVLQAALTLVLLAGSGLLLKAFLRMGAVPLGFNPQQAVSFWLDPPATRYHNSAAREIFYGRVLRRLAALPGVEQEAVANSLPLLGSITTGYSLPGHPLKPHDDSQSIGFDIVSPGFFAALQIPLLAGRGIEVRDAASSPPVAVINQTAARTLFPGKNPLGQQIKFSWGSKSNWSTIVGVVGDTNDPGGDLPTAAPPAAFVATTQMSASNSVAFVVRSAEAPAALAHDLRQAMAALDPEMLMSDFEPLPQVYTEDLAGPRFRTVLVAAFAALALLLTAAGLYSLLSYSVAARTREFGVRSALGAQPAQILIQVLRQALLLTASGIALGLASAWALTHLLSSLLWGVSPTDPWVLASTALLLLAVALAAASAPARHAMHVDAALALRCD